MDLSLRFKDTSRLLAVYFTQHANTIKCKIGNSTLLPHFLGQGTAQSAATLCSSEVRDNCLQLHCLRWKGLNTPSYKMPAPWTLKSSADTRWEVLSLWHTQLCRFTIPFVLNVASSVQDIFSKPLISLVINQEPLTKFHPSVLFINIARSKRGL